MNHMNEMDMELPQWITVSLCEKTVTTEVTGDCVLPDYQPEIRRLLTVKPNVLPPAKYVGGGNAEFNGTVEYQILYVGGDGELCSTSFSSEYTVRVPLEGTERVDENAGITALATVVGETVSARVGAPRRLNLRCRLRAHVCAYGKMLLEEQTRGGANADGIHRLREESRCIHAVGGVSEPIAVKEEILGIGENAQVISAEAEPFLYDVRSEEGHVYASGELLLKLLIRQEGMSPEPMLRKISFDVSVEMDGIGSDYACCMWGTVSELSVKAEEGSITCEAEVLAEARAARNVPVRYTEDLYSTESVSTCGLSKYELPVLQKYENFNLSQNERISEQEWKLPDGMTIVDVCGSAQIDACEENGGKYVLTGQCRYMLLCEQNGEYSSSELNLPLRCETEQGDGTVTCFDARATVLSCRARHENGILCLDAELAFCVEFIGQETICAVSSVEFGDALVRAESGMTVYYTAPDDTLWTVAKKYHVAPERLVEKKGKVPYYFFE